MPWLEDRAGLDYLYLTTRGRRTGRPHEVEIWFGAGAETVYLLSGGGDRSDWVRNLLADPRVTVRIDGERRSGRARRVQDPGEDEMARRLLVDKYAPRYRGSLDRWGRESLPVAIDLDP